jgi:hypothetical protein
VFTIKFPPGDTVRDAKIRIQQRLHVPDIADVTLILFGKQLRDAFVLDRLRIGTGKVAVNIRDQRTVVLRSAAVRRCDLPRQ